MRGFATIPKSKSYKSCGDIFQYLEKLIETGEYLYLVKRVSKPGIKSKFIPSYYWNTSVDLTIRRLKIDEDILNGIRESILPSSITGYLWNKGQEFNQIKERLINKEYKGLLLDVDRFDIGMFTDSVVRGGS